jgi:hypothetical protein
MFERFSENARLAVFYAKVEARRTGYVAIEPEHVLMGLARADSPLIREASGGVVAPSSLKRLLRRAVMRPKPFRAGETSELVLTEVAADIMTSAQRESHDLGHPEVSTADLLRAVMKVVRSSSRCEDQGDERLRLALNSIDPDHLRAPAASGKPEGDFKGGGRRRPKSGHFNRYTEQAKRVVYYSNLDAMRRSAHEIASEHLLFALLFEDPELFRRLSPSDDVVGTMQVALDRALKERPVLEQTGSKVLPLSLSAKTILRGAVAEANRLEHHHVGTEHLLFAMLKSSPESERRGFRFLKRRRPIEVQILNDHGFTASRVRDRIATGSLTPQERPAAIAEKLVAQNRKYYIERHQYRPVLPGEFPRLDLDFYDQTAGALEREGFSVIGDFEDLTASEANPEHRRFYRALTGDGGKIVALMTHVRGSDFFEYIRHGRVTRPRSGKSVEFATEFNDGVIIATSAARELGLTGPALIQRQFISRDLPITEALAVHGARGREYVALHAEVVPTLIRTAAELEEHRHRITELTFVHRKSLGGGFYREELAAMFKSQGEEFIEALYRRIQDLTEETRGHDGVERGQRPR